jgi:hypothetical protein
VNAGWKSRAKLGREKARFAARLSPMARRTPEGLNGCVQAFSPALCSPYSDEYAGHDCESGANGHDFNFQGRHGLILSGFELCSRENKLCLNFSVFDPHGA